MANTIRYTSTNALLNWDDPNNWSLSSVPQSGADVIIANCPQTTVNVQVYAYDPAYTLSSLTLTGTNPGNYRNAELDVKGSLIVTGLSNINGGELDQLNGSVSLGSVVLSNDAQIIAGLPSSFTIASLTSASTTFGGSILVGDISQGTAVIGSISGYVAVTFLGSTSAVTIGTISGPSILILSTGNTATIGTTAGTSSFYLSSGQLDLQSTATTLGDSIFPGGYNGNDIPNAIVDLQNIAYVPGESYMISPVSSGAAANVYSVTLETGTSPLYTFQNVYGIGVNNQTAPSIAVASDGAGGTLVTIACYIAGTRIATPAGERTVCHLAIGDEVLTADGTARPVKWIGRRSYAGRFLAANPGVQPIRFRAGSLGDGLPRRDLLVSPAHAMSIDGLLIPAHRLVNGTTVVQERDLDRVEYFHIELDSHDVILAEGAPSETFYDDHSRAMFHNASEFGRLYPSEALDEGYCAPRAEAGFQLEAVRRRLAAFAGRVAA